MSFQIKNQLPDKKTDLSFIIYHHHSFSEDELIVTIDAYEKQGFLPKGTSVEIIVMSDGVKLQEMPILEHSVLKDNQHMMFVESDEAFVGPGAMWNEGFSLSHGTNVIFTWTGVYWYPDSAIHLYRIIIREKADAAYGLGRYTAYQKKSSCVPAMLGIKNLSAECISFINAIPLGYMMITRDTVIKLKGFCSDRELAQIADWEFLIRVMTQAKTDVLVGKPINMQMPLSEIQYNYPFKYTLDQCIRHFITAAYSHYTSSSDMFLKEDINSCSKVIEESLYKIAIVSGVNENAQVQLCILNFLELINKKSTFTWRRFLETEMEPEELEGYNLVFFIRSRTLQAVRAATYCYEKDIKTVFVLDDNWFCATDTYPQLESQIGKHSAYYNYFIWLISTMDYLLVYNRVLFEDIKKYNSNIFKLTPNVNTSHFISQAEVKAKNVVNIGFAGSASKLQHFGEAFKALLRIMRDFEKVNLYFKGLELSREFETFKERIVESPYSHDYKTYAKETSRWHCDIMISPLDDSRYINSKCPNKYLEITALGAAGIYSNTELYRGIIKNRYNGLLINNNEEEWYNAIKLLITDHILRQSIIKNATEEINKKYETKVVLPEFVTLLETILRKA